MKKRMLFFIAVVVFAGISYVIYNFHVKPLSFVTISINPEVELSLNRQNNVVDVLPINEEADIITSDLNLIGLSVEKASEKIIDAAIETGYIDEYIEENTVVITTSSDDENVRKQLEEKIMSRLNKHFETRKIYPVLVAKGLDDELKAEAKKYGVSNGKMLLIERAVSLNTDLTKEQLAKKSIRDIQKEIKIYVEKRHEALKSSLKEAKETWKEKKQQLKDSYTERINLLKNRITEEQKEALKNFTPDQRKEAIDNYLKERKEEIKNNINKVREELKKEIKEKMDNYNYPIIENKANQIKEKLKQQIENYRNKKNNSR